MKKIAILLLLLHVSRMSAMNGIDAVPPKVLASAAKTFNMARELVVAATKRPLSSQQHEALEKAFEFGEHALCPCKAEFAQLRDAYYNIITCDSYPRMAEKYDIIILAALAEHERLIEKFRNKTSSNAENAQLTSFFSCSSTPGRGHEEFLRLQASYRDALAERDRAAHKRKGPKQTRKVYTGKKGAQKQRSVFLSPAIIVGVVVAIAGLIGLGLYLRAAGKLPVKKPVPTK